MLLCDRAAVMRPDLLEIAELLKRTDDPDPTCISALYQPLRSGCDSRSTTGASTSRNCA